MTKPTPMYVAGLFDGEGSIGLYRLATGQIIHQIRVAMCSEVTIDILHKHFGGSKYLHSKQKGNRRASYAWHAGDRRNCLDFLNLIAPHLIEKRPQAELMIRILEQWDTWDDWDVSIRMMKQLKRPETINPSQSDPCQGAHV